MNKNLMKLLLSLCLFLLVVLLLEWWLIGSVEPRQEQDSPRGPNEAVSVELPETKLSGDSVEIYSDMVERPLFIQGRRPVVEDEEEDDVHEVDSVDDLVLTGIYTDDRRLMALFSKKGREQTHLKKSQGDEVGGWILEDIRPDSVVLENAGKRQTLLLRKPKPTAPSKSSPATAPRRVNPLEKLKSRDR